MIKLTNKSSETHETYTFMSKVCEESSKIIDDMLAKKHVDGELDGEVHVSISIGNDEIDNVDTVGMARGIKARHCSRKGRKRVLSWVEKLAKKTKRCSQKKKETTIQETESSQVDNGTQHQATVQATQSHQVDSGTQHEVTIQMTQFDTL
jgi:hypothetical protein